VSVFYALLTHLVSYGPFDTMGLTLYFVELYSWIYACLHFLFLGRVAADVFMNYICHLYTLLDWKGCCRLRSCSKKSDGPFS